LDFLTACLRWDPERRLKPEQALQHEFITGIKRAFAPTGRPGRMGTTISGAHNSPIKRFNPVPQTPQRVAGAREASGTIRPLPEPPGTSFRTGPASSASPVKINGAQPGRRHSAMMANPQQPPAGPAGQGGPAKRIHTTGVAGTSAGLAAAIASGRAAGARAASGRADMASAAAAVSLVS
jgi:dual specificity tyrosine-phosphorylation-regulated kinase 2/3/4